MSNKYRPRVEIHATTEIDGVPHVLASKQGGTFVFPGGGVEKGQSLGNAAKNEMLEEAGYSIDKPKKFGKSTKYVMSQKWQSESKARRGVDYTGVNNQIVQARLGKQDMKRYNREGDAMSGLGLYPVQEVADTLQWNTRKLLFEAPDAWSNNIRQSIDSLRTLQKNASVKHTLITGHSGSGKTTLAKSLGMPIHSLDDDEDIRAELDSQMEYARQNQGRLPTSLKYKKRMDVAERNAIRRALSLASPHAIEGSYLLNRDPSDFEGHDLRLVDTPEEEVLRRRVSRQKAKDLARGRTWSQQRADGVRMRGQQLIDEYAPGVSKWRESQQVKKAEKKKLYHGSPHKLDMLEPRQAFDKLDDYGKQTAVYLSDDPEQAMLYSLMRPRGQKRKSWGVIGNKAHYLKGLPLNRQGYLYEVDTDEYTPPPKGREALGYTVHKAIKPTSRKRVRLRGKEDQFIGYDTKEKYKEEITRLLNEKLASKQRMYHGSTEKIDEFEPRPHFLSKGKPVVFGTPSKAMAILHGAKWKDSDFTLGTYNDDPTLHMEEEYPGAYEKVYKGKKGHLYELDPKSFYHGGDRYMKNEFISDKPPKILRARELDLYKSLLDEQRAGRLVMNKYKEKTASADPKLYRHRSSLLIRDKKGKIFAQRSTPEQIAEGNSRVSFPGGGIHDNESESREPTKMEILRAAKKEALEELGFRIKNPRIVGSQEGEMEDWWKKKQLKKRGVPFFGSKEHFVLADQGKEDRSQYNVEGDAFSGGFYEADELAPDIEQDSKRDSSYSPFNKKQLELIRQIAKKQMSEYYKYASLRSQESIFQELKRRLPRGAHHVSGGLPDAKGVSDVDIYLPRKKFKGLESKFPSGTSVVEEGDDFNIYSIPGFDREVNVYATSNPAKQESIAHRQTMMALAKKYPQLEQKAFNIKKQGKGSEPAWAEVLGLKGDPYDVMANTEEVLRHAEQMQKSSAKGTAVKRDPAKWARAKAQAKARMGGKHSARAMQLAVQIYKKSGGTYSGKKPSASSNKLKKWGKQKWRTRPGTSPIAKKSDGSTSRYLPEKKWRSMDKDDQIATDTKKRSARTQYIANTARAKVKSKAKYY